MTILSGASVRVTAEKREALADFSEAASGRSNHKLSYWYFRASEKQSYHRIAVEKYSVGRRS